MSSAPEGNPREDQGDRRPSFGIFLFVARFRRGPISHDIFVCKDLDVF